jgi:pimeloyl-ACP methyl ester carboxylesterase
MPQILVNGISIHSVQSEIIDKSKPTLLFVHGAGQRSYCWRFQEDVFINHHDFNYVTLDLPGRAGSEGDGYKTVSEYKDFLLDFIEEVNLENIIMIGHSMGGAIAMLIAMEHPELLKAEALIATSPKLTVAQQTLEKVRENYDDFCEVSPTRAFAEASPQELKDEYKRGLVDTGSKVCYGDLIACNEFDITDQVNQINVPTLIISADKDIMTPWKNGEYLHQEIYGSEFHLIKDSGHFVMQEKAHETNSILSRFLNNFIQ